MKHAAKTLVKFDWGGMVYVWQRNALNRVRWIEEKQSARVCEDIRFYALQVAVWQRSKSLPEENGLTSKPTRTLLFLSREKFSHINIRIYLSIFECSFHLLYICAMVFDLLGNTPDTGHTKTQLLHHNGTKKIDPSI